MSRLGALDGLRFLAAAAVVAFHFTARDSPAWNGSVPDALAGVGAWTLYGRLAVPLFFVISGFVILMSAWDRDVPGFVASRIGRLFPAYWVAVALSLLLVLYAWPESSTFFGREVTPTGGLLNLTMLQAAFGVPSVDGAYWTLWYEARFYLLVALLLAVGLTRARVLAFAALWPVAGALAAGTGSDLAIALLMPDYAPFFAGGMLLYLIHRDGPDTGTWLLVGMQAAIAVHFTATTFPGSLDAESRFTASAVVVGLLTVGCFGLVALATLPRVARWDHRWLGVAGALSYPVYLVHENVGWFVIHHMRAGLGAWGAVIAGAVAVLGTAVLLHRCVEQPLGPRLRAAALRTLRSTARGTGGRAPAAHVPVPRQATRRSARRRSRV
jgi:peptidoglycan/LPS O-acetylase OafA/YrhL